MTDTTNYLAFRDAKLQKSSIEQQASHIIKQLSNHYTHLRPVLTINVTNTQ